MPKENLCAVINAQRGHARRLDASPVHAEPSGVGERTGGLSSANVSWTIGDPFHTVAKNRPTGVDRSRWRASQQRRASAPGAFASGGFPVALPAEDPGTAYRRGRKTDPAVDWPRLFHPSGPAHDRPSPFVIWHGTAFRTAPSAPFSRLSLRDLCRPDTLPTALRP